MAANILGAIAGLGIENICSGIGKLAKDIKEVLTGEMSPENKAKIELQATELAKQVEDLNFKAQQMGTDIIIAEAKGEGWLQRNWRPLTMMVFVFIIANNYIIAPYTQAMLGTSVVLDLPQNIWTTIDVGLGGYVVGRSLEKVVKTKYGV